MRQLLDGLNLEGKEEEEDQGSSRSGNDEGGLEPLLQEEVRKRRNKKVGGERNRVLHGNKKGMRAKVEVER